MCCLKPLSLWSHVTTALGNTCTPQLVSRGCHSAFKVPTFNSQAFSLPHAHTHTPKKSIFTYQTNKNQLSDQICLLVHSPRGNTCHYVSTRERTIAGSHCSSNQRVFKHFTSQPNTYTSLCIYSI